MIPYNWSGLANATLSENERAYVMGYLLNPDNFSQLEKANYWVADLKIKVSTGLASKEDLDQLKRLEEIDNAYNIISITSKKEYSHGEEPKFTLNQLCDFLMREYQVLPSDPFIHGLIEDVFVGFREGTFGDINRKLTSQNFKHIGLDTLEGISALMLQEKQRRESIADPSSESLNGGYALYILMQDFSKLPQPLNYKFNPSVGKPQDAVTMEDGDDEYGNDEYSDSDDEVATGNSSEGYDDEAWGPMFNGRSSFSFDDGMGNDF